MRPYLGTETYIFVSYAHEDKEEVYEIVEKMQKRGYRIWYDAGIIPQTEYMDVIAERIFEAQYFIAFVSQNYSDSDFCKREYKYALNLRKNILPVFLEKTELNSSLGFLMSDVQGVLKYECENEADFYEKIYSANNINAFLEEDPQKILSEVQNALVINNCVPADKILSARLEDKIFPVLEIAYKNAFSHIPILDSNRRLIGIFGHGTWSKVLLDKTEKSGEVHINQSLTFKDVKEYINPDEQTIEEFVFLSKESTIFDIKLKTSEAYNKRHKGVSMFFITETGSKEEELLGILTPTGILGRKIFE